MEPKGKAVVFLGNVRLEEFGEDPLRDLRNISLLDNIQALRGKRGNIYTI